MNVRLKTLLSEAEARLDPAAQDRLGDVVEAFVSTWAEADPFTSEELAHLERIAAEPFEPAAADEVASLLGRRA